jgi:CheY-like chemotaxis protein/nitrogen-specific signal transduction histidine kinase
MQNEIAIENRDLICAYISDNPGSHLRKMARDLDIRLSTLRYHLDYLEKKQSFVCQRQNNRKVYFLSGKLKPQEKILVPLLQQQRYREIILILINSPGLNSSQIAERLAVCCSTASKYINALEDRKILFCKKIGRKKKYYINDEKSIVGLLSTYKNFMADMSFEIRTPMNTIMGMASLLLDEKLTPEQRDFVETIKASGEALMDMMNDILDFSKIERENIQLETQTFDLRNCIEEAQDIVAPRAAKQKINLVYVVDKTTPAAIIGDPNRLRQILVNLLNNAVESTEKGDVSISVSTKYSDQFCEIHFVIKDTGIGIPQEKADRLFKTYGQVIDRLFESFNQVDFESVIQVDELVLNKEAGASLGLAISKKLVELMNGKIWAESKVGGGTTIHFTIKTEQVVVPSQFSTFPTKFEGKRILIADGSRANCRVLNQQALDWGLIPKATDSGQEALRLIQNAESFDIALLDINMPNIDGESLAREIRNYNMKMPLVAMAFIGQRIKSGLFDSLLYKPLKTSKVCDTIISLLKMQSVSTIDQPPIKIQINQGSLSILLAEDNILNQKVFLTMLSRLGHKVDAVNNGIEALQAIERGNYDVVLMDIRMPEMNGLEATKLIRQRWHNGPKIVAVTAYALEGDREKFLAAGMDDYISKPIKMGELKALLEKYQSRSPTIA